jgi:hypothetical protein
VAAALRRVALIVGAALVAYLLWPYATLWRLDAAARSSDPEDLAALVDMAAVRDEIKRKLNKDAQSSIERLSDGFIAWLRTGIQTEGSGAVDRLVTLEWVRARLLAHNRPGEAGFLGRVSRAFFDAPDGLRVGIGPLDADPVWMRMQLHGFAWRVTAVYY